MSDGPSPTGMQHQAARRAAGWVAFAAAVAFPARGDPADDPSAVVLIGGLEADGALAAAGRELPRHWRLETLAPRAMSAGTPQTELDTLARLRLQRNRP